MDFLDNLEPVRIRMLVPRRSDGGHRDELWRFCRAHWERVLPEVEIVEGTHDGEEPFNRAWAVNRAAVGDWDAAIILDADVILEADTLRHAVDRAQETGHVILPFTERLSLDRPFTARLLKGRDRLPAKGHVVERQDWNISTAIVLLRPTWNLTGGFDERFEGWGGEDDAFHAVCRTVSDVERLPGPAWHLWHSRSRWRRDRSLMRQARALSDRYVRTAGIDQRNPLGPLNPDLRVMYRFLEEPRTPDQIAVVCLTNGKRPELLERTIASFDASVTGPIGRRLIVADRCEPRFPGWQTTTIRGHTYRRTMREATYRAIGSGQPWIFWLEDDWEFNRPVELAYLQCAMDREPSCVQMSLQRQAWYRPEIRHGGIFQTAPEAFTQREGWVAHRRYWTQNPMLTRRSVLAAHEWPQAQQSEWKFAELVFKDPHAVAGVWGRITDDPWVTHTGETRAGAGY